MFATLIAKPLVAAAALAGVLTLALPGSEAKAGGVDVQIGIGGYAPGYYDNGYDRYGDNYDNDDDNEYGYGGYRNGDGEGYAARRYHSYGISCGMGRNIVDRAGFNRVRPVDCSRPNYRYSAWKHGRQFVVRVGLDGEITRIRRVY